MTNTIRQCFDCGGVVAHSPTEVTAEHTVYKRHRPSFVMELAFICAECLTTDEQDRLKGIGFERVSHHKPRTCRVCGCTDLDCSQCIERTGAPCTWVEPDLCSACSAIQTASAPLATTGTTCRCGYELHRCMMGIGECPDGEMRNPGDW